MDQRITNWILATLGGMLISISSWLAIQLYNTNIKQTDLIERKLYEVHSEQIKSNENIIRLQESIKNIQSESTKINEQQSADIAQLKDENQTIWRLLINDPIIPRKRKNE